jgi:hypothetical protein
MTLWGRGAACCAPTVAGNEFMKQTSRLLGLALVLGLTILLAGCEPSGDSDTLSTSTTPGPRVEQQAVDNLLQLYGQVLRQEDINRLQALLEPALPPSTPAGSVLRQGTAAPSRI